MECAPRTRDGWQARVLPDLEVDDRSVLWLVYPKSNVLTAKAWLFIDFLLAGSGCRRRGKALVDTEA